MGKPYLKLLLAIGINLVLMFLLTYAMIASLDHFHANLNRLYMAVLMAAPMVVVMLLLMPSMFGNRALNMGLMAGAAGVFAVTFWLMRTQTPVGDREFLRSMIPHHSSAILMCEQASITDPRVVEPCGKIVKSQREEIAEMEALLARR